MRSTRKLRIAKYLNSVSSPSPAQPLVLAPAPLSEGAVLGVGLEGPHRRRQVALRDAADLEKPPAGALGVGEDVLVRDNHVVQLPVLHQI